MKNQILYESMFKNKISCNYPFKNEVSLLKKIDIKHLDFIKNIIKQTTITTNMTHLRNDAFQAALDSGELFNLDFQFSDAEEWTESGVWTSGKYASNDAPSWDDYDRRQRRWMEEEDDDAW